MEYFNENTFSKTSPIWLFKYSKRGPGLLKFKTKRHVSLD